MNADNWPSFAEELGRKALTTVEKWTQRHLDGKLSRRELFVLVDGLYDTISGLAPEDDLRVIEAIQKGIIDDVKAARADRAAL